MAEDFIPMPSSREEPVPAPLSRQEKAVFGADAKRGADGKVIEQGVGAPPENYGRSAHLAAREAADMADGISVAAKALVVEADKLAANAKAIMKHTSKSIAKHDEDAKALAASERELAEAKKK
jgi:hypothetical protein